MLRVSRSDEHTAIEYYSRQQYVSVCAKQQKNRLFTHVDRDAQLKPGNPSGEPQQPATVSFRASLFWGLGV